MQFDLGVSRIHKVLNPINCTFNATIDSVNSDGSYDVSFYVNQDDKIELNAFQLISQSYSYEEGDEVIIEVRSVSETLILGLSSQLNGTNLSTEFYIRLGDNVVKGTKDGTRLNFETGDGSLKITKNPIGTSVEVRGLVTVSGDMLSINNAIGNPLNNLTVCPLGGMHVSTVMNELIG